MSRQGAVLQDQNVELVKCIEDVRERMEQLDVEIKADEERKAALEQQLKQLGDQLTAHEETLGRKYDERAAHARTLHEAQAAYEKIIESSTALLQVLKKEAAGGRGRQP